MGITITAKPLEVKAELPGYGVFNVRRLGAGAEVEIQAMMSELQDLLAEIETQHGEMLQKEKELTEQKDKAGLDILHASTEYMEAQKQQVNVDNLQQSLTKRLNETTLGLWRSDDPKALEKMFNDFTIDEIRGFYRQVMESVENA